MVANFREKFQRTSNELSEFSPSPSKLVVLCFFLVSLVKEFV